MLEYHPNPNTISIHLTKKLTTKNYLIIDGFVVSPLDNKDIPNFAKEIIAIKGVSGLSIRLSVEDYKLSIHKVEKFDRKIIIDEVISILAIMDPDEGMVEGSPPIYDEDTEEDPEEDEFEEYQEE